MAHASPAPPYAVSELNTAASLECIRLPGIQIPVGDLASTIMQLQIVVVYLLTQALHRCIFKHFGLPCLVSQMVAGVILSPNAFYIKKGGLYEKIVSVIFPELSGTVWRTIAWLGCAWSSYMYALKINYGILVKNGQKVYILGVLGLLIPLGVNNLVANQIKNAMRSKNENASNDGMVFTSSIATACHFPVVACLLSDLDLLNSELGRLALAITLFTGMLGVFVFVLGSNMYHIDLTYLETVGCPVGIALLTLFVMRPLLMRIIQQTPKDRPVKTAYVMLVLVLGIVGGLVTHYTSNQSVLLGLFIVGAATPDGPPLTSAFVDIFDLFINGILMPFFITISVMRANLFTIDFSDGRTWQILAYGILPIIVKILLCLVCAMCSEMSLGDGVVLGLILGARGFLELSDYSSATESNILAGSTYTVLVLWVLIAAIVIPLLVRTLYNPSRKYAGYQKRDIMHLKHNSELKMVACIYRTEHASAITNLLDIASPTKNNQIDAYIIHLVKLAGRALPTFISHGLQQQSTSSRSHSEDIVMAFGRYQRNHDLRYHGGLATHLFTAVTLPNEMYEDICTLALNQVASLIVLPFHRKIGVDGAVESENSDQRSLTLSILDRAPCSVAVHVHRFRGRKGAGAGSFNKEKTNYSHNFSQTSVSSNATAICMESESESEQEFLVAVVFIGGNDDREALALAKWMARGVRVRVHIIRLMSATTGGDEDRNWEGGDEADLDSMLIQDARTNNEYREKFSYEEVTVKDGGETVAMVRNMADDYDLAIVGRRYGLECQQTAGLNEWSEVPEIGVIGDLLASPDHHRRTSVLVVQRQKQRI